MKYIKMFTRDYHFLSNFSNSPIKMGEYTFLNGEAAFQSFKDLSRMGEFQNLNPSEAKKLGRKVKLREDWESIKYDIMYQVVLAKFSQNEDLKIKLLDTGEAFLEEGTLWHDNCWGNCRCNKCKDIVGKNYLGQILMRVRNELSSK